MLLECWEQTRCVGRCLCSNSGKYHKFPIQPNCYHFKSSFKYIRIMNHMTMFLSCIRGKQLISWTKSIMSKLVSWKETLNDTKQHTFFHNVYSQQNIRVKSQPSEWWSCRCEITLDEAETQSQALRLELVPDQDWSPWCAVLCMLACYSAIT